jgi:hypothetical protein
VGKESGKSDEAEESKTLRKKIQVTFTLQVNLADHGYV